MLTWRIWTSCPQLLQPHRVYWSVLLAWLHCSVITVCYARVNYNSLEVNGLPGDLLALRVNPLIRDLRHCPYL